MKTKQTVRPSTLRLAVRVRSPQVAGQYDPKSSTWSDRKFAGVALKKHCEDR